VAAVYLRTAGNGFILLDDDLYLTENPVVLRGITAEGVAWAFTTFQAGNWHPLTWLSHMADVSLFGAANAGAHHLESAALHGANVLLFFSFLRRATGAAGPSLFAAALFAVHPVHVESVAWAAERKDLLCALFFLLALHAYGRYAKAPAPGRYAAVAVLFALALMSKPMAVTFPFVLLLLDEWPLGRTALAPPADGAGHAPLPAVRLLLEKIPLLLLAAASSAVTLAAQRDAGAMKSLLFLDVGERAANTLVSYAAYLRHLVFPAGLAAYYPLAPVPPWTAAGAATLLALLTAVAFREVRRRPFLLSGWLWFLGTLVPVIGLVQVGSQARADRYAYLPFLGLYAAAAFSVPGAFRRLPRREAILPTAACAAVLALAATAYVQAGYWKDSEVLFLRTLSLTENNHIIEGVLGTYYGRTGRPDLALPHCEETVRLQPGYSRGWMNLGLCHANLGRPARGLPFMVEAYRLGLVDPKAALQIGRVAEMAGEPGEAAEWYREALRLDPGNLPARKRLDFLGATVREGDGSRPARRR
jgi:tetratricopeptide (TPR) repeat protein